MRKRAVAKAFDLSEEEVSMQQRAIEDALVRIYDAGVDFRRVLKQTGGFGAVLERVQSSLDEAAKTEGADIRPDIKAVREGAAAKGDSNLEKTTERDIENAKTRLADLQWWHRAAGKRLSWAGAFVMVNRNHSFLRECLFATDSDSNSIGEAERSSP